MTRMTAAACALLLMGVAQGAHGETLSVSGRITKDTVWKGDVLVTDDVIVGRDEQYTPATLTIENATVRFARRSALIVQTSIIARSSSFTSAENTPGPGDWRGVLIEPPPVAYVPPVPPPSEFVGCTFEYAQTGLRVNYRKAAVALAVTGCQLSNCRWGGVVLEEVSGAKVADNQISGICLSALSDEGRPLGLLNCKDCLVTGNTIRECSDTGIALVGCQGCEIGRNRTENIRGGPHGMYEAWGFGIALLDSDDNKLLDNVLLASAYNGIWIAYGSDRNLVEGNRIDVALDAIGFTGAADANVCRHNVCSSNGWTTLYVCGSDAMLHEDCDVNGGGWCFTARSGKPTFSDCDWNGTMAMNFWGDSNVTMERCRLQDCQGDCAVNLQNQSQGTMTDCEFDKDAMTASPDSTGSIEVKYSLRLKVVDAQTGADVSSFKVIVHSTSDASHEQIAVGGPDKPCQLVLTEFVFDKAGKHYRAPYEATVEAAEYQAMTLTLAMDKPMQETVRLLPAH